MNRGERRLCATTFAAVLLLDLCWRSYFFNFDGVACAIAIQLDDFRHLAHGNHLAYGLVAWAFDRAWRLLGYGGDAVWTQQVLDSLLGAAGASAFASLIRRSGRSAREAFLAAGALAVSQAWWFWSLEAQVYMLGALFAALAAREALAQNPRPARVGLFAAAAILGHVGHVMAVPALLDLLSRQRRAFRPFLFALGSTLALSYIAAGILAVRPTDAHDLRLWLLGSAALRPDRSFHWHTATPLNAVREWSLMTLKIFADFTDSPGALGAAGVALALLPLACAARGAVAGGRAARFWLLWLAGYAALYLTWEPSTVVYRVSDLLGLWALALMGLDRLSSRARAAALAAWVALGASYNWTFKIHPHADPGSNLDYAESRWLEIHSPKAARLVVFGNDQVYTPFFAHRRPLNLRYSPDETSLDAALDALNTRGETIAATARALDGSGRRAEFERYGLETLEKGEGRTLYRVRRAASRTAAGEKN